MKILIDSREQNPFRFAFANIDTEIVKLDYGDYQIDGTNIIFERKANTGELYINLITKDRIRFNKLIDHLFMMNAYILCEFPESDLYEFPEHSGIPENKWGKLHASSKYLRKLVNNLQDRGLKFVFCEDRQEAERFILNVSV